MNGSQWYEGQPVDAELPERNRITLFKSGTLAWNGYEISSDELKGLLEEVSKQEFGPLTQFEWEPGAPCRTSTWNALELVIAWKVQTLACPLRKPDAKPPPHNQAAECHGFGHDAFPNTAYLRSDRLKVSSTPHNNAAGLNPHPGAGEIDLLPHR